MPKYGNVTMPCLYRTYNQCEMQLAMALEEESVTKELCLQYLALSDEMIRVHNFKNILARAAARHRLAFFYISEGDSAKGKQTLRELLLELNEATEQYGHNEDWDEYIKGVSAVLNNYGE